MKIGNPADKPLPATPPVGAAAAADAAAKTASQATASGVTGVPDASAKVELSSTAATLLSTGSSAEFDAEKVARIAQAIDAGTFRINPDAIADKLISNAQELLTKVQR